MRMNRLVGGVAALALLAGACGDDSDSDGEQEETETGAPEGEEELVTESPCEPGEQVAPEREEVKAVPDEYETIQAAVDASEPCDLVLVSPGVYNEAVDVETEDIVIRGLDRSEVVLDGQFELDNGIRVLGADGVAVENMTARNYTTNGFFWTDGAHRYRGSYLTAYNNGDYGVYAFASQIGLFEHSYGSGSPDAAFYIGECYPCNAVIDDVVGENNGLGYSGTNSGGDLYIINSTFRQNRAGIVPNSGTYEEAYPQRATTIVGNTVYANNNWDTPAIDSARRAGGNGILVAGGMDNEIQRNLVYDHDVAGIAVVLIDDAGLPDRVEEDFPEGYYQPDLPSEFFWPDGNVVRDNVIEDSRMADIGLADAYVLARGDLGEVLGLSGDEEADNCFQGNTVSNSAPADLEAALPCEGEGTGEVAEGQLDILQLATLDDKPESADYRDMPAPEPQEGMPEADSAPWVAGGAPPAVDLDAISVPDRPQPE